MYYYGARYYDPVLSVWLSADPALNEYLPIRNKSTNLADGGVYKTVNLNVYAYANNNPLRYTDPNGQIDIDAADAKKHSVLKGSVKGAEKDISSSAGQKVFKKLFKATPNQMVGKGKGPTIKVKKLKNAYGEYRRGNKIYVDEGLVNKADSGDLKAQEVLEDTIVHETGHWADAKIKGGADTKGEEGEMVEKAIYGKVKVMGNVSGKPNVPYTPNPCG